MSRFDLNKGALSALTAEYDVTTIPVSGEIPRELNGTLLRNGPNPLNGEFNGHDLLSWWPEAAMFHGLYFENGTAVRYRNRWARTRHWGMHNDGKNLNHLLDTNPNVNFIRHADEILALAENGKPLAINADLESIGPSQQPGVRDGVSAHPKKDPSTGELVTFRTDWNQPWLTYGVTGPDGKELYRTEIDIPSPIMMHDMAITSSHSVLLDLGVAFDFGMIQQGFTIPIRWHEERSCRIGVIARHGGAVLWIPIQSCFIQHIANAYNTDNNTIVLEAVRYPWFLKPASHGKNFLPNPLGVLWRYTIDLENESVQESAMDDRGIELPRIDESLTGKKYNYVYAAEQPTNIEIRGVIKYQLNSGQTSSYAIAQGDQSGEPVFIPREKQSREDDGWLLVYVYRANTDSSDLIILDAQRIEAGPVASIHLPLRVPAGFHAYWLPA